MQWFLCKDSEVVSNCLFHVFLILFLDWHFTIWLIAGVGKKWVNSFPKGNWEKWVQQARLKLEPSFLLLFSELITTKLHAVRFDNDITVIHLIHLYLIYIIIWRLFINCNHLGKYRNVIKCLRSLSLSSL